MDRVQRPGALVNLRTMVPSLVFITSPPAPEDVSQPAANRPDPPDETSTLKKGKLWEYADLGFDTEKKLWFVQFFNDSGQNTGAYMAKTVFFKSGDAIQYQWKDSKGRPFWHVRERFFPDEIEKIDIDTKGHDLTIIFKQRRGSASAEVVPKDYAYILYAFHLANKEGSAENRPPTGFVEFYGTDGRLISRFNNRWIAIEGANRKTVGDFPKIRVRVERNDVGNIILTDTVAIIQGRPKHES